MDRSGASEGFSLAELLVAMAISAVLASIAVPSYQRLTIQTKRAEVATQVTAIRTAEMSYFEEFGEYVSASEQPRAARDLDANPATWPDLAPGFDDLDWRPDSRVFCNYKVDLAEEGGSLTRWGETTTYPGFIVLGKCDLDNDGSYLVLIASDESSTYRSSEGDDL